MCILQKLFLSCIIEYCATQDETKSGGLDCKNNRVQKCLWKKVEVRHTKDGKGSGLFAMEDIEKDNSVIEYVGKIEYKKGKQLRNED
jgi:hypothetical protein